MFAVMMIVGVNLKTVVFVRADSKDMAKGIVEWAYKTKRILKCERVY